MVILEVHIKDVLTSNAERDTPIGIHCNTEYAFPVTLQLVQPESRQLQIINGSRAIHDCQNILNPLNLIGADSPAFISFKQPPQGFMFEVNNHQSQLRMTSGNCQYSGVDR